MKAEFGFEERESSVMADLRQQGQERGLHCPLFWLPPPFHAIF